MPKGNVSKIGDVHQFINNSSFGVSSYLFVDVLLYPLMHVWILWGKLLIYLWMSLILYLKKAFLFDVDSPFATACGKAQAGMTAVFSTNAI